MKDTIALDARRRLLFGSAWRSLGALLTGGGTDSSSGGWTVRSRHEALALAAVFPARRGSCPIGRDRPRAAGQGGATARIVQLTALVTVLSLAPSLLVMVTAFTRIVIVLSLLRTALGTQGAPPN